MGILALLPSLFFLQAFLSFFASTLAAPNSTLLFSEYIGAESQRVKSSDLPINPNVEFHFILAFAVDYTPSNSLAQQHPTNGKFNIFWDTDNLRPSHVAAIKRRYENVKVALSLGGDSVDSGYVYFQPSSIDSWVINAAFSLIKIIKEYDLDGIDIDYEHFSVDPGTFAECIGRLVTILKNTEVISFASIAPFEDDEVQSHYSALWRKYRHVIDYVNFQFYAYDRRTTVPQFLHYFESQRSRYKGGKILASFTTEGEGGLSPENGFFSACERLKKHGNLAGIFIWCADTSKQNDFRYEKQSQNLLESKH